VKTVSIKNHQRTTGYLIIGLLVVIFGCAGKTSDQGKKETAMHKLAKMKTPVFWAEGHPGKLDRENWKVEVTGLCAKPAVLTWQDLQALPKSVVNGRLTSVTRWSVGGAWGGVRLSDLLAYVQADSAVKYVRFWSHGMVYDTSIPVEVALLDKSLLAWEFDGELLTEDYGGPVRAFIPYLWGYKSAKSVVKVELMDKYVSGFWEQRGYTDAAEIEAGPCRDINDGGRTKYIPDGEVTGFLGE
jgi:DMSO/TMAO reductase YedYZ molybdopterin-dependent catalytic subunit